MSGVGAQSDASGAGVWVATARLLLLALVVLSPGCGRRESNVERGNREQILFLGNGTEPKSLDPHIVTGVTEHNVMAALLEGLVSEDPTDLHPVPGVAARWEISDDGLTYTFHLRATARWSNGDPVTAEDFAYSYRRMLTPELAAEYAYMLYPLRNARAYNTGAISDFTEVGVEVTDERTLILKLGNPTPYFLELLNHFSWWPVHPPTIEKFGGLGQRDTPWTRPGNFVGNGPFLLSAWEINRRILVRKSPTYWDADHVKLAAVEFLPIDSADTEERAFRDGDIHVSSTVPLHRIDYYRRKHPDRIRFDTYLGTYFYRFNVTEPPLSDKRVRKALSMVINREALTQFVLKAGQRPAYHFTPPNTSGYTSQARLGRGADEAKRLMAEAGYPDGHGFPVLELLYNTSEAHRVLAEAIQQMWKQALNIDVKLANQEWKVYLDSVKRLDYRIARAAWIGDYNDPNTFLDMWVSNGGNNRTGWVNEEYDRLILEAGRTADSSARVELFDRAEAILMDELPIAPIYFYVRSMLIRPSVQNWCPTILDHHPYKYVFLQAQ